MPTPRDSDPPPRRTDRVPARPPLAAWRPFLTGVAIGLAFLVLAGLAFGQAPDARAFDALLRANVRAGVVNYPGFQENASFGAYVADLAKPARFAGRNDELAVLHQRLQRARDRRHPRGALPSTLLGRARYFKFREWPLAGRDITLYDLEHKVIRPLGEPRIHFAIICASQSCPFLRSEAYTAASLDAQLDEQARQFVNDPFRNRFDKATRTAHLSEIFKWFDEDFRASAGSTQKVHRPVRRGRRSRAGPRHGRLQDRMDRLRLESQRHPAAALGSVGPPVTAARRGALGGLLRHLAHGERVAETDRARAGAPRAGPRAPRASSRARRGRKRRMRACSTRPPPGCACRRTPSPALPYDRYERRVQAAVDRGDLVEAVVGTQVVLEALGEALLARLDTGLARHGAGLSALRRRILAQEAAHHAFGRAQVAQWLRAGTLAPADLARHLRDYRAWRGHARVRGRAGARPLRPCAGGHRARCRRAPGGVTAMRIAIVVPFLDEAEALPATLAQAAREVAAYADAEVIAVDGGSADASRAVAAAHPFVRVLAAARGRATQMNAGAAAATGDVLLFLHADTLLPDGALAAIAAAAADPAFVYGGFQHRFSGTDWRLRAISALHNFRCRITGNYYGDQAMFVRRSAFAAVGRLSGPAGRGHRDLRTPACARLPHVPAAHGRDELAQVRTHGHLDELREGRADFVMLARWAAGRRRPFSPISADATTRRPSARRAASASLMRLSIVIPALDEAADITATLAALQPLRARGHEVIVVDGGSRDATLLIARLLADRAFAAPPGRAVQMNAGARRATGDTSAVPACGFAAARARGAGDRSGRSRRARAGDGST